ncbi:MAG TPA: tetratricopeptide repeat protein, partial [Thermoanaerobaculia bacterium]
FAQAFETSYGEAGRDAAARAYAEAEGRLAVAYQEAHLAGDRKIVDALRVEEPNLLQARRLALAHGWRVALLSSMHGLHCLYEQEGRRSEWKRLVEEIAPAFVDPHTDGPAPGAQEPQWDLVNRYRMDLAVHRLDFAEAERLLERSAAWNRGSAAPLLDRPVESLTGLERNAIRALAGRLHDLALVQSMTEKEECVPTFREALALSERMGDRGMAAVCAFNLGAAYAEVEALRDFDEAERWIRASLDWLVETDGLGRGRCNRHLGRIARQRFRAARLAGRPPEELLVHLREAARLSQRALELLPLDAVVDLGEAHHELGDILSDAGEADQALSHYRQAIQYSEQSGRGVNTGLACYNIAVSLHDAGRQADALEYAEAALRCFESAGAIAAKYTENARRTIALLSASMHNP